jgi:hypothetical protein
VWGSDPENVYAVSVVGQILHFDGAEWRSVDHGPTGLFWGIWGSDSRNIYVPTASGDDVAEHGCRVIGPANERILLRLVSES